MEDLNKSICSNSLILIDIKTIPKYTPIYFVCGWVSNTVRQNYHAWGVDTFEGTIEECAKHFKDTIESYDNDNSMGWYCY